MKKMTFILFALLSSVLVMKAGLTDEEITLEPLGARNMVIQASILDRALEPGNIRFGEHYCESTINIDPISNIMDYAPERSHYSTIHYNSNSTRLGVISVYLSITPRIVVSAQQRHDMGNEVSCRAGITSIVEAQRLMDPIQFLIHVRE